MQILKFGIFVPSADDQGAVQSLWQILAVWGFVTVLIIVFHVKLIPYAYDDAYIHIRIARNLASVGVPYFNVDEPVMASSSTGWTLFLAFLFKLFGDHLIFIALCNGLFTTACVFVYTRLVQMLTGRKLTWFLQRLFSVLTLAILIRVSAGLMETPITLLILGVAVQLYWAKNNFCFCLFGMAIFSPRTGLVFCRIRGVFLVYARI